MLQKSELSTKKLRERVRWFALGAILLLLLTGYSLARIYVGAQGSQAQIALAMRQVSEVTWRVKSLEMWTRLTLSEARNIEGETEPLGLQKSKAFALSDARALNSLPYLSRVIDQNTIRALQDVLRVLETIQDPTLTIDEKSELLDGTLEQISVLVKEAGNLNFESVANLLTDNRNRLVQNFVIAAAVTLISLIIALALWITERSLTKRLIQSDKTQLETLGALSSGFAHVTQNTLWSLRESLMNLQRLGSLKSDEREGINRALSDIKSLNALNMALTKAAHDPSKDDERRGLGDIVEHIKSMFDDPSKPISIKLDPTIKTVELPFATTVFIISELINNALDALKAERDDQVKLAIQRDRKSIIINVEDTGAGMSVSVADNCLSPFFTTKPESSGHCGFGLHSIARLISGMDGHLKINSKENVGTRISITIPRGAT